MMINDNHRNLSYEEACGIEHSLIFKYRTLNSSNKMNNQIRGISPKNKRISDYMNAAMEILGEETYVGEGTDPAKKKKSKKEEA